MKHTAKSLMNSASQAGDNDNFLRRWSRRKLASRQNPPPERSAEEEVESGEISASVPEMTEADMPPLEVLNFDSDYSGFLSSRVSDELRRTALRKLFHMPELNVVDGLDDYARDYTQFVPLGDTITADMRHALERLSTTLDQPPEQEIPEQVSGHVETCSPGDPDITAELDKRDDAQIIPGDSHDTSLT